MIKAIDTQRTCWKGSWHFPVIHEHVLGQKIYELGERVHDRLLHYPIKCVSITDTGIEKHLSYCGALKILYEPCHEKPNVLHVQKQRRRSASR